jgi:hypothetical protein
MEKENNGLPRKQFFNEILLWERKGYPFDSQMSRKKPPIKLVHTTYIWYFNGYIVIRYINQFDFNSIS